MLPDKGRALNLRNGISIRRNTQTIRLFQQALPPRHAPPSFLAVDVIILWPVLFAVKGDDQDAAEAGRDDREGFDPEELRDNI